MKLSPLPSRLVERWGTLPYATTRALSEKTGVSLPPPWDRLSANHIQGLREIVLHRPIIAERITMELDGQSSQIPEEIPEVFRGFRSFSGAKRALEAFRGLSAESLNRILWTLHRKGELKTLLNDFWSWVVLWNNKKELVEFLTRSRLNDLTVPVRAALVLAMQEGITAGVMEEGIVNILTGTRGEDLTRLKGILDRYSPQDFQKLVEGDIDSERRRRRIFEHVAAEAAKVSTDIRLVLSDIDDTLYRNWKDTRYPDEATYPGVIAFYGALGTYGWNDWERWGPVFVSARPRERLGIIEEATVGEIRDRGIPYPTILSAGLWRLAYGIEYAKYKNFVSYHRLFPEFQTILIGDNGQKDEEFFRRAIESHPEAVPAAFIHDVAGEPVERLMGYTCETLDTTAGQRKIFSFDTYIGAALAAHEMTPPLISPAGLQRVVRAATAEISSVAFESREQKAAAHAVIGRDRMIFERKYGSAKHP